MVRGFPTGVLAAVMACGPGTSPPLRPGDDPTATAPLPGTGDVLDVECRLLAPNAIRAICDVVVREPGPVTAVVSAPGLPARTFETVATSTEHQILLWALHPETTYDWDIAGVGGTLTTEPLPPVMAGVEVVVQGESPGGFDVVVQPVACADSWYFVMVDPDGTIVWAFINPHRAGNEDQFIAVVPEMVRLDAGFPVAWIPRP